MCQHFDSPVQCFGGSYNGKVLYVVMCYRKVLYVVMCNGKVLYVVMCYGKVLYVVRSWCDRSSDQSFMVDPLSYFSF